MIILPAPSSVPTTPSTVASPSVSTAVPARPSAFTYHLLARSDPQYRWWRPVLLGLTAVGLYVVALLAIALVVVVAGIAFPSAEAAVNRAWEQGADLGDPLTFGLLLGSVALMLPAVLLASHLVGARPAGLLTSVVGRMRWRWLGVTLVLAFAVWVPVLTIDLLLGSAQDPSVLRSVPAGTTIALLLLTVALVPVQAAAEEYVFRGFLAQLVGSWLRHPAFAVLLPVPLFVAGHGYGFLGAVDVAVFAVVAGYLAWRTGGLEASIAMHMVNNVVLMSISAIGLGDPNATDTDLRGLAVSVGVLLVYAALVVRRARADGITRVCPAGPADPTAAAVVSRAR